jgi:hypothetical protein
MYVVQELKNERLRNTDNIKLHEAVARATPTKNSEIKVEYGLGGGMGGGGVRSRQ